MIRNSQTEVWVARDDDGGVLILPSALPPVKEQGAWGVQVGDSGELATRLLYFEFRLLFGQPLPKGALIRMAIQSAVLLPDRVDE